MMPTPQNEIHYLKEFLEENSFKKEKVL